MARGTGKFKTKRGGGRNFSKNMVLDENGTAVAVDNRRGNENDDDDDDDEEDEEDEEEEESDDDAAAGNPNKSADPELTRAERRELKKKQAAQKQAQQLDEDDDPYLINPNHVEKKLNISDLGSPREPTRREREQKEKADAKERYWKLHVQGKTQEAKADLSRLAKIRAEREAAQTKRKAEADAKAVEIEAKRKAQQSGKRA